MVAIWTRATIAPEHLPTFDDDQVWLTQALPHFADFRYRRAAALTEVWTGEPERQVIAQLETEIVSNVLFRRL